MNVTRAPGPGASAQHEAEREAERLVGELRRNGVTYLAGGYTAPAPSETSMQPDELLRRLSVCDDARVRDATIALVLLHPTLVTDVSHSTQALPEPLMTLLLAATYLQASWRTRLTLALGPHPGARYDGWRPRDLPAPWRDDGEPGLRALAAYERRRVGHTYNFVAAWTDQVDHLCAQAWANSLNVRRNHEPHPVTSLANAGRGAQTTHATTRTGARGLWHAPRGGAARSMREPVDKARIQLFVTHLGEEARQPGASIWSAGRQWSTRAIAAPRLILIYLWKQTIPAPLSAQCAS